MDKVPVRELVRKILEAWSQKTGMTPKEIVDRAVDKAFEQAREEEMVRQKPPPANEA